MKSYNICIVDDHTLFTSALASVINQLPNFQVIFNAENGQDFIEKLKSSTLPDIVLLDLNMPIMNGYETLDWIRKNHPTLKVMILSMNDDEVSIIQALKKGANGYLLKNVTPKDLQKAFEDIITKGVYHSELVNNALMSSINTNQEAPTNVELKEHEIQFLKFACTEMTYREIAEKMSLSPKTIDGYRQQLFEKLNVKSRVGLAMYAIQHKLVDKLDV